MDFSFHQDTDKVRFCYRLREDESGELMTERIQYIFLELPNCHRALTPEDRVWRDHAVLQLLRDEFVIVALYVDDKTKLPEDEWVTTSSGAVLKDVGRVNSWIALEQFGVNAQPNYFILAPDGSRLAGPRGYDLDIPAFVDFLKR